MIRVLDWIRLRKLIGATGTPTDEQEGQIRYTRDGAVDGTLQLARKLSGGTNEWKDLTAAGGAGAPTGAKYITQTAHADLSAEQALGALATGILKSTTTTGVLSIAVGADLPTHTHAEADVTSLVADLALKAPLASPTFTGTVTIPVALTGVVRADSGVLSVDTDVTDIVAAASDTAAGKVELATTAETTTGTDATRAVTPDGLHDMTSLAGAAWFLDEDAMGTNSDTKTASQQSIKAYADTKQTSNSNLTTIAGLTATTGNMILSVGSAWASQTPAQVKTALSLNNVDNTSDAGKPVSTAQQTALDAKAPVAAKYIVQTADATLSAEQALGALGTGIVKNTTTTGVLSIAVGADLPTHTHVESDTTNLVADLAAKATSGAALTEAAEANSTPVAGATSTALGSGIRVYAFFTLPSTEKWYVITGIEWLNKATVNGNVWCGVERVDANPPVLAGTVNVAVGARLVQTGANGAQRNSQIASNAIRGGTILGVWFTSDSATATFGNTAVGSANNRKTIAAGTPVLADVTAWTASTAGYYVKAYYQGIK